MKKTIKLCFIGYLKECNPLENRLFTNELISNKYDFVIDKNNPDYVFVGSYGDILANTAAYNNCVKIWYIEEPFSPNFTFFDYCIDFDPYDYGGRNIFYPDCLHNMTIPNPPSIEEARVIAKEKTIFCSMIFAHETHDGMRKKYYDIISKYKRVESAGTYLNNQDGGKAVGYENGDGSKFDLQKKCKFDLCIQTLNFDWFINEKIVHCIVNNTIPIFYGTDKVKQIFNPKRFIFVEDYKDEEELLNYIKKIDEDDELYAQIISEDPLVSKTYQQDVLNKAFLALDNIFENGPKKRRNTLYASMHLYNSFLVASRWNTKRLKRESKLWYRPFLYFRVALRKVFGKKNGRNRN